MDEQNFHCPITEIIEEKDISSLSQKEIWHKKRDYCLTECEHECDMLIILKKIYWELRKQK